MPADLSLLSLVAQFALGMGATVGFALLFNTPRHVLLQVALIGGLGHTVRYLLRGLGVGNEAASFSGAFVVGICGFYAAKPYRLPRLILTVTAIVPMIPGILAYETIVFFANGQYLFGIASGIRAALIAGSLAAGLTTARMLTDQRWTRIDPTMSIAASRDPDSVEG